MNNKPVMKVDANGTKEWYLNGKFHREDGPAIECFNGIKCWYLNGEYHREDGPAMEYPNGIKWWFLNGKKFSFEDYIQELRLLGKEEAVINLLFELDAV
jgi:hypothetical protein